MHDRVHAGTGRAQGLGRIVELGGNDVVDVQPRQPPPDESPDVHPVAGEGPSQPGSDIPGRTGDENLRHRAPRWWRYQATVSPIASCTAYRGFQSRSRRAFSAERA